jgi:hypothetical protein
MRCGLFFLAVVRLSFLRYSRDVFFKSNFLTVLTCTWHVPTLQFSYQMDSDVRRADPSRNPSGNSDAMVALNTSGLEMDDLLNGINLVVQPHDRFAQCVAAWSSQCDPVEVLCARG